MYFTFEKVEKNLHFVLIPCSFQQQRPFSQIVFIVGEVNQRWQGTELGLPRARGDLCDRAGPQQDGLWAPLCCRASVQADKNELRV